MYYVDIYNQLKDNLYHDDAVTGNFFTAISIKVVFPKVWDDGLLFILALILGKLPK